MVLDGYTTGEQALAYLDVLEADRKAALTLSEQKAEEAKLIQARQEGFRAALDILCGETSAGAIDYLPEPKRHWSAWKAPAECFGIKRADGQSSSQRPTGMLRPRTTEIRSTRRNVHLRFCRTKYARCGFPNITALRI